MDKFVHPASKQHVLYPYAKGKGAQRPTGTRRLASADHFYLQQESGTLSNKLDEARKKSETLYFSSGKRTSGPLAQSIYDDGFVPSANDVIMLAGAAAFLRCGSPVQVHNTAMMALLMHQQELFNRTNTDEVKEDFKKKYGDDADQKLQEARDALWKGEVFVDVGEENWKQLGFTSFQTEVFWVNALTQMGLTVCTSHPNSFFLTSDNPVILTSHSQKDSPGLGLKDAEVWFPISYKRALLWRWKHRVTDRTTLGHSATRVRNRNMIRWCYNEVYAPLPEVWINSATKGCTFDTCYGHYGSLDKVANDHAFHVVDDSGMRREIVDILAGLRTGEKVDVLQLKSSRNGGPHSSYSSGGG